MKPIHLNLARRPYRDYRPVYAVVVLSSLLIAFLMISTIPTFSGKTMGKRVPRDWVVPLFVVTAALFSLLVSFPFEFLAVGTLLYLAAIPFGIARYRQLARAEADQPGNLPDPASPPSATPSRPP